MQVLKIEVGYLRYKQSPLCAPELLFLGKFFIYISVLFPTTASKGGFPIPGDKYG